MSSPPEGDISQRVESWTRQRDAENAAYWRGRRIGDFTVIDLLGLGGMGVVLSAIRGDSKHQVALKLIRPDLISSGLVKRLQREHDTLMRLDHPGIARLFGLHLNDDGQPFLEMEKVDGMPLDAYAEGRTLSTAIELLEQVARCVGHAHDKAVVHRDLKPGNVLVDAQGRVKLLDFGIAKTIEEESLATMTATGERLLTPRYAAPEQLLGGEISPATDVFAIGVMLCELCMGESIEAEATDTAPTSSGHRTQRSGDGSHTRLPLPLDTRLRDIALRAMETEPELRYRDGNELADDLHRWRVGEVPMAGSWFGWLKQHWRQARLRRRSALLAITATITIAVLFAAWQYQQNRIIDIGYGFIEHDLAGMDSEARRQTRRALALDANGARETALGLIQNAHRQAPGHPLLSYLELTWTDANSQESQRLYQQASTMLQRYPNAYLQALLNAEGQSGTNASARRRLLRSALEIRPNAWRLRYALAHGEIGSGKPDLALKQLQQIDIRDLRDRRAAQILFDRALLGDAAGARAAISGLPIDHPSWHSWVEAGIAFSEGDYDQAHRLFTLISRPDIEQSEPAVAHWGRAGQILCLGQSGGWQELAQLAASELRRARERGDPSIATRSGLLGAIAAQRLGDRERMRYFLDGARKSSNEPLLLIDVALTSAALGESPGDVEVVIRMLPEETESLAGLASLLKAAQAFHRNDMTTAAEQLKRADIEGVAATRLSETARWFGARLNQDPGYQKPERMLWFAPWSNWVAAWIPP